MIMWSIHWIRQCKYSLRMKAARSSIILMESIKQGRKLDVSFLENAMILAEGSV